MTATTMIGSANMMKWQKSGAEMNFHAEKLPMDPRPGTKPTFVLGPY
jgi:hypothetical protein